MVQNLLGLIPFVCVRVSVTLFESAEKARQERNAGGEQRMLSRSEFELHRLKKLSLHEISSSGIFNEVRDGFGISL